MKFPFDKLIARLVGLGVPGLVLVVAVASSGLAGGAAIVAALAFLGGPFGMMGGVLLLGLLLLVAQALAEYGFEAVFLHVLRGLKGKGFSKADILRKLDSYPISLELKLKLGLYVEKFWDDEGPQEAGATASVRPPFTPRDASAARDIPREEG